MQRLTIDLKKNAEVADLVSDKQPGDRIMAELSIVSMDEQSLVVELDSVHESAPEVEEAEEVEVESDDDEGEFDEYD